MYIYKYVSLCILYYIMLYLYYIILCYVMYKNYVLKQQHDSRFLLTTYKWLHLILFYTPGGVLYFRDVLSMS